MRPPAGVCRFENRARAYDRPPRCSGGPRWSAHLLATRVNGLQSRWPSGEMLDLYARISALDKRLACIWPTRIRTSGTSKPDALSRGRPHLRADSLESPALAATERQAKYATAPILRAMLSDGARKSRVPQFHDSKRLPQRTSQRCAAATIQSPRGGATPPGCHLF